MCRVLLKIEDRAIFWRASAILTRGAISPPVTLLALYYLTCEDLNDFFPNQPDTCLPPKLFNIDVLREVNIYLAGSEKAI